MTCYGYDRSTASGYGSYVKIYASSDNSNWIDITNTSKVITVTNRTLYYKFRVGSPNQYYQYSHTSFFSMYTNYEGTYYPRMEIAYAKDNTCREPYVNLNDLSDPKMTQFAANFTNSRIGNETCTNPPNSGYADYNKSVSISGPCTKHFYAGVYGVEHNTTSSIGTENVYCINALWFE